MFYEWVSWGPTSYSMLNFMFYRTLKFYMLCVVGIMNKIYIFHNLYIRTLKLKVKKGSNKTSERIVYDIKYSFGGFSMKGTSIEERAISLAHYIIDTKDTVRGAAKKFGVSKSTVHTEVTQKNGKRF